MAEHRVTQLLTHLFESCRLAIAEHGDESIAKVFAGEGPEELEKIVSTFPGGGTRLGDSEAYRGPHAHG